MFTHGQHVETHLDDYLHDLLASVDDTYVEQHCHDCDACAKALADARKRQATLEAVAPHEASDALIQQTLNRIDTHEVTKRRRRKRLALTVAAIAAALVLGVGTFHFFYMRALTLTPYDLQLLGQRHLQAGTVASLRIVLFNHDTGKPIGDVPVALTLRDLRTGKSDKLNTFTTDDAGTGRPRFTLPDWPEGDYTLTVTADTPGTPEIATQSIHLKRAAKLMLTTDKP